MGEVAVITSDIEESVIEEFIVEFHDSYSDIESILLTLENNPSGAENLNSLFRHVHSIKGNLQLVGLDPIADFVHALESVLDKVRKGDLKFNRILSDVVLLAMDHTRLLCDKTFEKKPVDITLTLNIQNELRKIATQPEDKLPIIAKHIINAFDPQPDEEPSTEATEDLNFFTKLAELAEVRSPYWNGRTHRIYQIAMSLNQEAGYPVDPMQLSTAIYLHDFGMSLLPLDILHKTSKLSDDEFAKVKIHPKISSRLLNQIPGWEEAATIIIQHHEREDGHGYPYNIKGNIICDGAKILAIADTFDAMTHERANRQYKRPLLRAISEINNCAGVQFSAYWVDVFNNLIRKTKVKKH